MVNVNSGNIIPNCQNGMTIGILDDSAINLPTPSCNIT